MSDSDVSVKELGDGKQLQVEEFIRTLVQQMFENDNDTTYLDCTLKAENGVESFLEFEIRVKSINGIATRDEE